MTFDEYIQSELKHTRESRHPNAISLRFVQLHEQSARNASEEDEYRTLLALMRSRWRWYEASASVQKITSDKKAVKTG